jgi:hypothetical protein
MESKREEGARDGGHGALDVGARGKKRGADAGEDECAHNGRESGVVAPVSVFEDAVRVDAHALKLVEANSAAWEASALAEARVALGRDGRRRLWFVKGGRSDRRCIDHGGELPREVAGLPSVQHDPSGTLQPQRRRDSSKCGGKHGRPCPGALMQKLKLALSSGC